MFDPNETEYLRQENDMFRAEVADLTRKLNHAVSEYDVLKLEHQLIKEYDLWEAIGDEKLEGNILASVAGAMILQICCVEKLKSARLVNKIWNHFDEVAE